jgi:histone deacetylase 11
LSKGKEKLEAAKPPLQLVYSPKYKISFMGLENLHPFDVGKYNKIYEALKNDGLAFDKNSHAPDPVTEEQLLLVHTKAYLKELEDPKKVSRYLEAPVLRHLPKGVLKRNVADRFKRASGGTIKAARLALEHGYAVNIGGGFHHAKPTKGEGFCIIADVPIAIRQLQKDKKIKKALIIDTDVHQGNGTVVCLANDPSTYTFSMHQGNIYPIPKEVGDKDIELKSGMKDEAYLAILERELPKLFAASKPDIVFYVAGCDTLSGDPLASLEMSHEGIAKRDLMVAASCFKHKVPFVMTLSGGYSKDAWKAQHLSIKGIAEWTIKNPF